MNDTLPLLGSAFDEIRWITSSSIATSDRPVTAGRLPAMLVDRYKTRFI
jgi:hypothetical protein